MSAFDMPGTLRWLKNALALIFVAVVLNGCATWPSELSRDADRLVVVKCARLPRGSLWIARFAEHAWVDVKTPQGFQRIEVFAGLWVDDLLEGEFYGNERWGRNVHVIACYEGDDAERIGAAILEVVPYYPYQGDYRAWPGPNSNTFVEWLSQQVPGFAFELPPNAVGKDYVGWGRFGITTTRAGLELETVALGVQVGLAEGVELHLLGLTMGVGLWPPQIKLPFVPAIPFGFGANPTVSDDPTTPVLRDLAPPVRPSLSKEETHGPLLPGAGSSSRADT